MTSVIFKPVGIERGVLAFEAISPNDWGGIMARSFDTTNTPEVGWKWQLHSTPVHDIDATLREATERYGDLLRRLAD